MASTSSSSKSRPLISTDTAALAGSAGAGLVNETAEKIKLARADGPFTFRMLGFLGGLAMIVSNGLAILDRFFSFNFAGAMIAVYGVIFGIIIALLEAPGSFGGRIKGGIRYYAKFLEFTWGRGALFVFVGTLQISNWNMLDWAVGGFMIFVGLTAIGVGIKAARDLRLLKFSLQNEAQVKEQWDRHDADGSGYLDFKELTEFVKEANIEMDRNGIAATFLALDKNFDDKITYEEFFAWWTAAGTYGAGRSFSCAV